MSISFIIFFVLVFVFFIVLVCSLFLPTGIRNWFFLIFMAFFFGSKCDGCSRHSHLMIYLFCNDLNDLMYCLSRLHSLQR